MSKIFTVLALATAVCWPAGALAASDADVPKRGMSKTQVRAQFGEPERARPAVGQPPISRWDYDGFSVYFENDITLHSVREDAPIRVAGGEPAHSTAEADAGASPANGEEPPTGKEEQETNIEVETFDPPSNKEEDKEDDEESSTESETAPGSTGVRAKADSADESANGRADEGADESADESTDGSAGEATEGGVDENARDGGDGGGDSSAAADEGRFRFDPATGRIVVSDDDEETGSGDE